MSTRGHISCPGHRHHREAERRRAGRRAAGGPDILLHWERRAHRRGWRRQSLWRGGRLSGSTAASASISPATTTPPPARSPTCRRRQPGGCPGRCLPRHRGVSGSAFADTLTGDGAAKCCGAGGDDVLAGGAGADALDGGSDVDTADYSASSALVIALGFGIGHGGDAEGDTLRNIETLVGSAFDDQLIGSSLDDTLVGGAGNDTLIGGGGADHLDGGDGVLDITSYTDSSAGVTIDLSLGTGHGGTAEGDTLSGIETCAWLGLRRHTDR